MCNASGHQSFTGIVTRMNGRQLFVKQGEVELSFTMAGDSIAKVLPGHHVTVVTMGSGSVARLVNLSTDTVIFPTFHWDPADAAMDHSSSHDVQLETFMANRQSAAPWFFKVLLLGVLQTIPVLGQLISVMLLKSHFAKRNFLQQVSIQRLQPVIGYVATLLLSLVMLVFAKGVVAALMVYFVLVTVTTFLMLSPYRAWTVMTDQFTLEAILKVRAPSSR